MRGSDRLEELVDTAPLPLAQGVARMLNAKTDIELHSKGLDLVELTVALAGVVRLAFVLDAYPQLPAKLVKILDGQLSGLAGGSGYGLGKFTQLLTATAAALDESEGAELLGTAGLTRSHDSWLGMAEYGEELLRDSSLPREAVLSTRKRGLIGFFELCTTYRNREKGHGATRYDTYYERMGPALCGALADVLTTDSLLGPGNLVSIERFGSGLRQRRLRGCIGRALRSPISTRMWEGSVAWKLDDRLLPLAPFLTHWMTKEGSDRIGVLSRLEAGGKRARYVDYPSGDQLSLATGATQCRALHRRIHADGEGGGDEGAGGGADGEAADGEAATEAVEDERFAEPPAEEPESPSSDGEAAFDLADYDLVDELGRGGMGVVYLAKDRRLDREVAIKVSAAPSLLDELNTRRLRRETVALARADHPNVIKVFSSGRAGGEYYFAMEHIDGVDLAKLSAHLRGLREQMSGGEIEWRDVVEALRPPARASEAGEREARRERAKTQPEPEPEPEGRARSFYYELASRFAGAARGVGHLHAQGVIHRDIKPSNLMMSAAGDRFVVTDLGLAKLDDASVDLTKADAGPIGTLRYSAPEQLQPDLLDVDERTDVYGLGATLYELATGRSCHDELEDKQLIRQILLGAPTPPHRADPDIPRELAIVIEKALAKEPERRYASAEALAEDLDRVAAYLPPLARPVGPLRRLVLWTRRHPSATLLGSVAAVLLVLGGWLATWLPALLPGEPSVEEVGYYASLVERWGVNEGYRELRPWALASAWSYYAVFTLDGRVVATERRHGSGSPFPNAEGVARWEYEYTAQGRLHEVTSKTANGAVVQVDNFDCWDDQHCRVRVLDEQSNLIKASELDGSGEDSLESYDVFALEKTYDELGRLVEVAYLGPGALEPRPHPGGYWGTRFDYEGDELLAASETHLGPDGEPMPSVQGVAAIEYEHDDFGHPTKKAFYDEGHAAIAGGEGCAVELFEYAAPGAMTASRCFDGDEQPALTDDGWAHAAAKYDGRGNQIEIAYFGVDGAPVIQRTSGAHRIETSYDRRGYSLSDSFFGVDGQPVRGGERAHRIEYRRDDAGNLMEVALFDGDGQPDLSNAGLHSWRYTRNAQGDVLRYDYFDAEGRPVTNVEGHAAQVVEYDERGRNKALISHYGLDGEATTTAAGYHAEHDEYDARGNLIAVWFTDTEDQPTIDSRRVHRVELGRDDFGRKSSVSYFGGDGQPVLTPEGFHRVTYEYDRIGQVVAWSHHGVDGQPIHRPDSAFRIHQRFDRFGRITVVSLEDADGQPALSEIGAHAIHLEYDHRGRVAGKRYFGLDGEPVVTQDGFHRYVTERDQFGQVTAIVNYGVGGERRTDRRCWREESDYDELGQRVASRCYGLDGRPTLSAEGYHLWRSRHDDRGRLVEWSYAGVAGEPVLVRGHARGTFRHDARGNVIEHAAFGVEGEPVAALRGAHRNVYARDRYGRITRVERFGVNGERVPDEGCLIKNLRSNAQGMRLSLECLDADGQRMVSDRGWSRVEFGYDARGDAVDKHYFGVDEEPVEDADDLCHRRVSVLDRSGRLLEDEKYDVEGELVSERRHSYDARGHLVHSVSFGADGVATLDERGCHAVAQERDALDRLLRETCLGVDGRPRLDLRGVATTRWTYDPYGLELSHSYHGPDDEAIAPAFAGYHAREREFDARGHLDVARYFDAKGRPTAVDGQHEQRLEHDALGRRIAEMYFGPTGKPVAVFGDGARFHRRVSSYDDEADMRRTRDYGVDGQPVPGPFVTETYDDEAGRMIRRRFFDADEQPTTASVDGVDCHELLIERDPKTGKATLTYLDVDGRELPRP